jgi:N-acetylglucosamine-6-phosphate deacetylase
MIRDVTPALTPRPRKLLTGQVVLPDRLVPHGVVALDGDRIAFAGASGDLPPQWADVRPEPSAAGTMLLPGLTDIHCHGGNGGTFGTDVDSARVAAGYHHRAGSTTVVGSLVSAPIAELRASVTALAPLVRDGDLAGIHLEGPFLSLVRCGAQNPAALIDADPELVAELAQLAGPRAIAHLTFAPERPGADRLPRALADAEVLGAIGHTDCDYASAADALRALASAGTRGGRPLVTHLFNGMAPLQSRAPGAVGAALAAAGRGEAVAEVIADGVHLDGGTVRMLFDTIGAGNMALVSDAMAASGLQDGQFSLGGQAVEVRGRQARLAGSGSLAGGVSTLLEQVRWCAFDLGVGLVDAVLAAATTPARALALDGVGSLTTGNRADVLVVDDRLVLQRVLRGGEWLD